jgi:hypothetical protein
MRIVAIILFALMLLSIGLCIYGLHVIAIVIFAVASLIAIILDYIDGDDSEISI